MTAGVNFGAEQTGKREWRAWVYHAGKRHWIGCRDNQADAMKAASRVYWSLRGYWDGQPPPAKKPTEGLPKVASGGLAAQGLSAHKKETRYPSIGQNAVRAKAADTKGVGCEHCGAEMFRPRGRFCSNRCRMAASRLAASS